MTDEYTSEDNAMNHEREKKLALVTKRAVYLNHSTIHTDDH